MLLWLEQTTVRRTCEPDCVIYWNPAPNRFDEPPSTTVPITAAMTYDLIACLDRRLSRPLQRPRGTRRGERLCGTLLSRIHTIDLYNNVLKKLTEWPTSSFSIETLAKYLSWRDSHSSGAAFIEWFHRWIESKDPAGCQRILNCNVDDCRATRVLRDELETRA
jgi:hypothetical protein